MKFTLKWLKEHLDTEAGLAEVTARLTAIGLEVEGVEDRGADLAPFIVGDVVSAAPHPDADKLQVCMVQAGPGVNDGQPVQVICGAPNARAGMKGVFAAAGTTVPGTGMLLKKAKIRGVESNGMLCSMREMGLSDEHEGIIELPAGAPVGAPFAAVMGLDDPVIEIAVTPNRGDCLGVRGIARDLAAAGLGTLKPLDTSPVPGAFASPIGIHLRPHGEDGPAPCPLFVGRLIRGVKNGDSPAWLQDRLRAIGLRPISVLVDITNWATFALGRPLHVFDADTIAGDLWVGLSEGGESLLALDERTYDLPPGICVIGDDDGVLSLGGIMGGESSGCTPDTVNVLVEAALFDPLRTAASGRQLGILSDARYRFERGLDPEFTIPGMEAATRLILELCGGEPSELVVSGAVPDTSRSFILRPGRLHAFGGLDLPEADAVRYLERLGFEVRQEAGGLQVSVPSWRPDIGGENDLIEEVLRLHGYDRIPAVSLPPASAVPVPSLTLAQRRRRDVRRALAGRGYCDTVGFSFIARDHAMLFGGGQDEMVLANPMSPSLDTMRPSLLPSLLAAAQRNADRGHADTMLMEVAPQYFSDAVDGQTIVASGLRHGAGGPRHWQGRAPAPDVFAAKADAIAALEAAGAPAASLQVWTEAPDWFHPGRSGTLRLGPKLVLAEFGEIHPRILQALDLPGPAVGFTVYLERVPAPKGAKTKSRGPLQASDLQAVHRDFAFLVAEDVAAQDLVRAAAGADKVLIDQVSLFDLYAGKGIPEGQKSLAIEVRLQPQSATLTEAEIAAVSEKVVAAVAKATGGTLRG
ncbi:phenylalanine--tRNA ligase subunit beta [Marinibaculum pumilum]|uniref:Phenylalanine--tRNA ligase beta subunit n=1 Tax=Marinibaculum pumilum TaxID=1766165 RepID=A0ABV7L7R6_9PROT